MRNRKVDVFKQRFILAVRKRDMRINDVHFPEVRLVRILRAFDRIDHIEVFEDASEKRKGTGEVHLNVQKGFHGSVKAVDKSDRGGNGANFQSRIQPPDDKKTAGKLDQQRSDLGKHPHHYTEPLTAALFLHGNLCGFFVDTDKLVILFLFTGKEFNK